MIFVDNIFDPRNEKRFLDLLAGVMVGFAPIVHIIVVNGVNIPYGRFASPRWGFLIDAKLAWFLQELPAFFMPLYLILTSSVEALSAASIILLGLYMMHYANRSLVYPLRIRGGKPTPMLIALFAFSFCSSNGYLQTVYQLRHANYDSNWIYRPHFIAGICIFLWGMRTNIVCDGILRDLRKPGETDYKIPRGDMFEYVSCGNLFGESVEWVGFAIASWSLPAAAFAIFTTLMLSARSYTHHMWYLKKFDNYPKSRRIFIPFLL